MSYDVNSVPGWAGVSQQNKDILLGAATRYNIEPYTMMKIISLESGFDTTQTNPMPGASAAGWGQVTKRTAIGLARQGKVIGVSPTATEAEILQLRYDPIIGANFGAAAMAENVRGLNTTDPGDIYLGHFLGTPTAKKVIAASNAGRDDALLSDVIEPEKAAEIYAYNPWLKEKGIYTVGDFRRYTAEKMGVNSGTTPSTTINQNSTNPLNPSANTTVSQIKSAIRVLGKARNCQLLNQNTDQVDTCKINTGGSQVITSIQQQIDPTSLSPADQQVINQPIPNINVTNTVGDVGTSSGLRLKSSEAIAGGNTQPGTFALGHAIQNNVTGFNQFTAFDDNYHRSDRYVQGRLERGLSPTSTHSVGRALDFTINNPSESHIAVSQVRGILTQSGANAYIQNEYTRPSPGSNGGHIHVNFNSDQDAEKFAQYMKSRNP